MKIIELVVIVLAVLTPQFILAAEIDGDEVNIDTYDFVAIPAISEMQFQ